MAFYDRSRQSVSAYQALDSTKINAIKFGPYDNGHVVVALDGGVVVVLNAITLLVVFKK